MIEVTEEDMKMLECAEKNDQWIKENYEELEKSYPEMWVAVHDSKVLASSKDFDEVLDTVRKEHLGIESYLVIEQIRVKPLLIRPSFVLKKK